MGVQVLSYTLMAKMTSEKRIAKILEIVKTGDIVMLEGRLKSDEEAELIAHALKNVNSKFSGIEIANLDSLATKSTTQTIKDKIIKLLARERFGITVIGPSKLIKDIKMDPHKLEILF